MTWNDHDHRGEYAREHHLHYDLAGDAERAHRRITGLQDEVDGLRAELAAALDRIGALEGRLPGYAAETTLPLPRLAGPPWDASPARARPYVEPPEMLS
jgi:hypothetical protein